MVMFWLGNVISDNTSYVSKIPLWHTEEIFNVRIFILLHDCCCNLNVQCHTTSISRRNYPQQGSPNHQMCTSNLSSAHDSAIELNDMATNTWIPCREQRWHPWSGVRSARHGCCVEIQMTTRCLQKNLLCPNKNTGTASQLFKILFWVEGWVLTEVQYNVRFWQLTTEPRPCKLSEKEQVSTMLKASSTRIPVCHAWRRMKMMSTKSRTPLRDGRTHSKPLSIIASAVKAADDIADHLLTADQKGNDAFTTFIERRLQTSDVD